MTHGKMTKFRSTDKLKEKAKTLTENSKNLDNVTHHPINQPIPFLLLFIIILTTILIIETTITTILRQRKQCLRSLLLGIGKLPTRGAAELRQQVMMMMVMMIGVMMMMLMLMMAMRLIMMMMKIRLIMMMYRVAEVGRLSASAKNAFNSF